MRRGSRYPILFVVIVSLGVFAYSAYLQEDANSDCNLVVSSSESIQAAVDAAAENEIICLSQGTWRENISLTTSLEIRAIESGQSILTNSAIGLPIVHITSASDLPQTVSVKISGVVITGADGQCEEPNEQICPGGMLIDSASDVAVENSSISLNLARSTGIWLRDHARISLNNTTISSNGSHGLRADDDTLVEIRNSTILDNGEFARELGTLFHGIQLSQNAVGVIQGSNISNNFDVGVFVIQNASVEIRSSNLEGNFQGVEQGTLGAVTIENSVISGSRSNGILIGFFGPVVLNNNAITGSSNFGITIFLERCGFNGGPEEFGGSISGRNNTIPGPNANDANENGAFCPNELQFLLSEEGGMFP